MLTYETIKKLCKDKGVTVTGAEKELAFARGSLCKVNTNKPSMEKVQKLANYFDVSVEHLMSGATGGNAYSPCPDCGMWYDPNEPEDVKVHERNHDAWEKAVEKFGELYCNYVENEKIKADNRKITHNDLLSPTERCNAQIEVLRCLFSRSVEASGFNLEHVTFRDYIAMMNKNPTYKMPQKVHDALVDEYGLKDGISSGTYYHIPQKQVQTIAAHLDASDLTDKELTDVQEYIEFIKSKRGK